MLKIINILHSLSQTKSVKLVNFPVRVHFKLGPKFVSEISEL